MLSLPEFDRTIKRIELMLEEGQDEAALAQLDALTTDDPQHEQEITYTRARYYIHKEQWEQAIHYLALLYDSHTIENDWDDASHTERERRAFYLLWSGYVAVNLSRYDDASQYLTQCLKILGMRRVHLPKVQIKALYYLATICVTSGLYAVAIQHYEEALKICTKEKLDQKLKRDVADIYHGLAEAHRQIGNFDSARTFGRIALQIYQDLHDRYYMCRMYSLLGRIAFQWEDYQTAADHYMESLSLATLDDKPGMLVINFAAMADLHLIEGHLDKAKRYCDHALEKSEQIQQDHHVRGMMYIVCGKVEHEMGKQAQGHGQDQEAWYHLEEALAFYKRAEEQLVQTQAKKSLSELYGRRAQVYEDLNRPQEAIASWKSAFNYTADSKGRGWYE